ncbi:PASTA domain-containing protein [candidate division KSB1 bacterium]|nr:PASTA domain-containing protein [candidate division KSB1 bacterium]
MERANAQYIQELKLNSSRGLIYDRNFNLLAINKSVFSVGVDVTEVKDVNYAAAQFAELLDGNKAYYLNQLSNGKKFFWLKRGVDEDIVNELQNRQVYGLQIVPEFRRFYPQQRLAAHVVGFTNVDMKGLSGVELVKDDVLSGNAGLARLQRDAFGKPVADRTYEVDEPESGKNVVLTIDNEIQLSAEQELQRTVKQYGAEGGIVVVTNPMTGDVLAMAVSPTFDPNKPGDYPPEYWRSRAITDNFEPGSTFKPIFMAAVLEEDVQKPDDIVFCENGKYNVFDQTITDVHGYGWLTLRKVIAKSSNIGMSKLAQMMKNDVIYQYARAFGFGVRTGIDLSGEVAGELKHTIEWSKSTPLALSRGYEVSVTPIQMAMAYGAIANGGRLLKPRIFANEFQTGDAKQVVSRPDVIRQVVSPQTSNILVDMLEEVVSDGTGKLAQIPGVRVAGKTGTAWKYDVIKQAYSTTEYYSSFIGFFPIEKPELLIYVMVDNPKHEYFGGIVAATMFKRIGQLARRSLALDADGENRITEIEDSTEAIVRNDAPDEYVEQVVMPDVTMKRAPVASKILGQLGVDVEFDNYGQIVRVQNPAPGTVLHEDASATLTLVDVQNSEPASEYTKVPKVIGLTIRDAMNQFALENLHVLVQGSGKVVRQSPKPGEKIKRGARCVIECEPSINLAEYKHW